MTKEVSVKVQTFFKVANVNPLDTLKEAFLNEYDDEPEMLINAGLLRRA